MHSPSVPWLSPQSILSVQIPVRRDSRVERCAGANPQGVRNAIRKLRRKLGDDAGNPEFILSDHGLGYRMTGAFLSTWVRNIGSIAVVGAAETPVIVPSRRVPPAPAAAPPGR